MYHVFVMRQEVQIGHGRWVLPGTLSIPQGEGPFAAVLLVHGAGPQDRDETLGPNKPFRDLAWGLASRGIAVLRYEKRTRAHADKIVSNREAITVKEEMVDDAVAAVQFLQQQPAINPSRIFLLGHSLGGMMAPRIAREVRHVAGLIILAGATRPLEDLILEQMTAQASASGTPSAEQKAELKKLQRQVERVKDPKLSA